jgi:hypothetical protein
VDSAGSGEGAGHLLACLRSTKFVSTLAVGCEASLETVDSLHDKPCWKSITAFYQEGGFFLILRRVGIMLQASNQAVYAEKESKQVQYLTAEVHRLQKELLDTRMGLAAANHLHAEIKAEAVEEMKRIREDADMTIRRQELFIRGLQLDVREANTKIARLGG